MPPETAPTAAVNCSGVWSTPLLEAAPDDNVNVTDNEKHRFRAAFQSGSSTRVVLLTESLSSVELQHLHAWCYDMWVRIDDDGRKYCAACKKSTNSNRFIAKDKIKRGKQVHRTQWLGHCIRNKHVKKLKTLGPSATPGAGGVREPLLTIAMEASVETVLENLCRPAQWRPQLKLCTILTLAEFT